MDIAIVLVFIFGYIFITLEHVVHVNKAASALITGVLCWVLYVISATDNHLINEQLTEHLGEISGILFFLLGAMTIVELIDAHDGFEIITRTITTRSMRKLLWLICLLAFFLSAVLDNLTATIVMISLLRKLIADRKERLLFAGMIVISANAGGAWSPIGDVTTTMLWIGGQLTSSNIIIRLIVPSLVCLIVPVLAITAGMGGKVNRPVSDNKQDKVTTRAYERNIIFFSGLVVLLMVPVFKTVTHLPPFMGMMLGLGFLWIISEVIHKDKDQAEKSIYSILHALRKIDMPSVLFFLGILLAISALQSGGQLEQVAAFLERRIGNIDLIVITVGLLSAFVDNVPLVAATMGMFDMQTYPADHYFWEFLAYCAGTGGSALIIGSAAGVAAMGLEKIDFFWYLRKISWLALLGYSSGAIVFILQQKIF